MFTVIQRSTVNNASISYSLDHHLYVRKADTTSPLLGVISQYPGVAIGGEVRNHPSGDKEYYVALLGRVPVHISAENGNIQAGDYLTASSIKGTVMKAVKPGRVIGIALDSFNPNIQDATTVLVFVNPHWYMGSFDELGLLPYTEAKKDNENNSFLTFLTNLEDHIKQTIASFTGTITAGGEWVFEKIAVKTARIETAQMEMAQIETIKIKHIEIADQQNGDV